MCVRVRYSTAAPYVPYDPDGNCICLPLPLPEDLAYAALRAILDELAVEQPPSGARCFCGASVVLAPRVPEQRRSVEVMGHGA